MHVIGLPRTGTTALGSMLSLDPQFRSLRMWEQRNPVPPPVLADELDDPRRLAYAAEIAALPPEAHAMHLYEVDASVEDSDVLGMAFHGQQYTLPVYGYHRWWRAADSTESFAYHRRVAKLLASQRPPHRWLYKAPHHKFHLDAVVAAYPDARFVMTHRDPAKSVPSYASLVSSIFPTAAAPAGHDLHPARAARCRTTCARAWSTPSRRAPASARTASSTSTTRTSTPTRWARSPGSTTSSASSSTPTVERVIDEWQRANRTGAHGSHRYTPEQFGLERRRSIRDEYDFYIRRFDVHVDG